MPLSENKSKPLTEEQINESMRCMAERRADADFRAISANPSLMNNALFGATGSTGRPWRWTHVERNSSYTGVTTNVPNSGNKI